MIHVHTRLPILICFVKKEWTLLALVVCYLFIVYHRLAQAVLCTEQKKAPSHTTKRSFMRVYLVHSVNRHQKTSSRINFSLPVFCASFALWIQQPKIIPGSGHDFWTKIFVAINYNATDLLSVLNVSKLLKAFLFIVSFISYTYVKFKFY